MDKRIIAEIPIYAFSPEEFEKRWRKKQDRKHSKLIASGYSEERAIEFAKINPRRRQWKYNPLVGMLCLYVKNDDSIYFGLYCRDGNRKYTINAEYYTLFPDRCTDVSRKLIVFKENTNKDILRGIKAKIEDIKHLEQIHTFYIDTEAFENLAEAVNFKILLNF